MQKYCTKCGSRIDEKTGLCPNCDKHLSKKEIKTARAQRKKTSKKEKKETLTTGKRIKRFLLKVFIGALILTVTAIGISGSAVFFGYADIPIINDAFNMVNISPPEKKDIPETDMTGLKYYTPAEENIVSENGVVFVNNEIIVTLKSAQFKSDLETYLNSIGGKIVGYVETVAEYQILLNKALSYAEIKELESTFEAFDWVVYASPNYAMKFDTEYIPNDKKWKNEWDKVPEGSNWGMEAIDAPGAWEYKEQMSSVNIGVIDNMFDIHHKDLNFAEKPLGEQLAENAISKNEIKWNNHGTHTSGTIAALFDNDEGVSGGSVNTNLYGFSTRGAESDQYNDSHLLNVAFGYLIVQKKCSVINISMGFDQMTFEASRNETYATEQINSIASQIEKFLKVLIDKDYRFVICKAAGNQNEVNGSDKYKYFRKDADDENTQYAYYSYEKYKEYLAGDKKNEQKFLRYKNRKKEIESRLESGNVDAKYDFLGAITDKKVKDRIIMVGSAENLGTKKDGFLGLVGEKVHNGYKIAASSQCGERVDILAPGVNICSTIKNGYGEKSGTSMAAPHVAAVAGLVFSVNPDLKGDQVKKIICDTAVGSYGSEGYGLLNAKKAVEYALAYNSGKVFNNTISLLISGYDDDRSAEDGFNNSVDYMEMALREVNVSNITKHYMSEDNRNMTHIELESLLRRTFSGSDENGLSIIYYGGHSLYTGVDENGNLTGHLTTFSNDSFQTFYDLIKDTTKGTVLLIYDGCFAGELMELSNYDNRIKIIATCDKDDESTDMVMDYLCNNGDKENACSIFAYAFKDLISTGSMDIDKNGIISFDELHLSTMNLVMNICQRYTTSQSFLNEMSEFYLHQAETLAKITGIDKEQAYRHSSQHRSLAQHVQCYPSKDKTELFNVFSAQADNASETSGERDIVLALDVSGSMEGKPIEETKKASLNFINTILKEDASIGIVTYDNSANVMSDFSGDEQTLKSLANNISGGGGTNIEAGLARAVKMLGTSNAKKKIIVLMSDGEPNDGKVGEELISYADEIKRKGIYIYTLGFFENMGSGKSSAQVLMEKIASDGCHYEVADADDLKFFFGDIADQINGQKYIYVRIACPVDVSVVYNKEELSSYGENANTRTSFGSLTFEENENSSENSTDDRTKILRLKDEADYNIKISGNGKGTMDYIIGFMDENGEYSDLREFKDIKIYNGTQIDTVAKNSSSTMLKVDSDGDGKYDLKYKARANEMGKEVNYAYIIYMIYGVGILVAIIIVYAKIKRFKKKLIERERQKKAMQKKFCVHCGSAMPGDKNFCTNCGKPI